jgi:hypothetical protein
VFIPFLLSVGYITKAEKGSYSIVLQVYLNNQDKVFYADIIVFLGLVLILLFTFYYPKYSSTLGGISKLDVYKSSLFSVYFGGFAFAVIILSAGGVGDLLRMAQSLRAGKEEISAGFLFHFAKLLLPGTLVLYSSVLQGKKKNIILFLLFFVLSSLLLMSLAGRAMIIIYLASFIYLKFIKDGRVYLKYSIPLILILAIAVFFGDYLFNMLSGGAGVGVRTQILLEGGANVVFQSVLREFTFPYTNLLVALKDVSNVFDIYVLEFAKGVLNLLPLGTIGLSNVETLSNINTVKYGTEGQIPVDLLSFSYYSMGVLGVIFIVSIFCVLYKSFDRQMDSSSSYESYSLHSIVACKLCFVVMYADMEQFLTGNFYIFLFISLCFIFKEVRMLGVNDNLK